MEGGGRRRVRPPNCPGKDPVGDSESASDGSVQMAVDCLPMTDGQFLERWHLWMTALNGREDSHSLVQQMESLCWNIAVYEALMASWKTETAQDGKTINVNSVLFTFVFQNFGKSFCLDLRRLTEVQSLVGQSQPRKIAQCILCRAWFPISRPIAGSTTAEGSLLPLDFRMTLSLSRRSCSHGP